MSRMADDKDNTIQQQQETIAKLTQQLQQQAIVIAAIQKQSRIWLYPWTMGYQEVRAFSENNRRTFGQHCLMIPSSTVKHPTLLEISGADEDQVRELIANADKCFHAMLANARSQAQSHNQQEKLKRAMQSMQKPQPLPQSQFDSGAVEIPSFKMGDKVFSLPTFDKKKRAFQLPTGETPGKAY